MKNAELIQSIADLIRRHRPDMMGEDTPTVLTQKELADILRVSERGLYRHVLSGSVPHFMVGGSRRFILSEVLDAMSSASRGGLYEK